MCATRPLKPSKVLVSNRSKYPAAVRADPLAAFDDKDLPLETVCSCLEAFVRAHNLRDVKDRVSVVETYYAAKPGSKAFLWLFRSGYHDCMELLQNPRFVSALCFCIVAERAESHLWN